MKYILPFDGNNRYGTVFEQKQEITPFKKRRWSGKINKNRKNLSRKEINEIVTKVMAMYRKNPKSFLP